MCIQMEICNAARNIWRLILVIFLHQLSGSTRAQKNKVEIFYPYHPLYVQADTTLKLTCNTTRRQVEWVSSTANTVWVDKKIQPNFTNDFRIELWTEEPSGNVSSSLFKNNFQIWDRGTYTCRTPEMDLQYSVWVTAIRIISKFIVMKEAKQLHLECNITGFMSNAPLMKYDWYYNNTMIKDQSLASDGKSKYKISPHGRNSRLIVYNLDKDKIGLYECEFALPTSIGNVIFSDKLTVKANDIPQLSKGSTSTSNSNLYITLIVIFLTYFKFFV